MNAMPRISIIILNWNGWEDTIECLESVYQITYPNYDVIVVDNGSNDESVRKIKEYAEGRLPVKSNFFEYSCENKPIKYKEYSLKEAIIASGLDNTIAYEPSNKRLILIKAGENFGFAEGNNIGIRYTCKTTNPSYILLLNNDTVVDSEFLSKLVCIAETDKDIGICGSKLYFYTKPNLVQFAGGRIHWPFGEVEQFGYKRYDHERYSKLCKVDMISGCSFLMRSSLIPEIGLLNQDYFAYYEDTEYCTRAKDYGYDIVFVPDSKVWHKISVSSTKTTGFREYYSARNLFWFMQKHSGRLTYFSFLMYFFCFKFWVTCAIITFLHRSPSALPHYCHGIAEGVGFYQKK